MVLVRLSNGSSGSSSIEELSVRPKSERSAMLTPAVQLYPLVSEDGLLVKIQPPRDPNDSQLNHVPCDLVLSIDVSGSMGASAPIPARPGEKREEFGLSVLDLVKHAARSIMETLDSRDRLGIVTFSSSATVSLSPSRRKRRRESARWKNQASDKNTDNRCFKNLRQ